ncbi:hypothetical protein CEV32_2995 [Brucella rhizosphaerae]|uniref:Uncharacterized protein n=1 Tax=Brucella rhizosphaerae TaxID=571254 RepID=A0A256F0B6_9HYPH|nr:hypothetical protein CEV32_2995 [Brucella rhizosphaerae]
MTSSSKPTLSRKLRDLFCSHQDGGGIDAAEFPAITRTA